MDVAGNAPLRHTGDDFRTGRMGLSRQPCQIQMAVRGHIRPQMGRSDHLPGKLRIILPHHIITPGQHLRIPAQLHQADGRHDVRHIAFIKRGHHIVFPCPQPRFGQGVLALAVQTQQHILLVQRITV